MKINQTIRFTTIISFHNIKNSLRQTIIKIKTNIKKLLFVEDCYSPTVTLIPDGSSLSSPTSFRRNQDFYIISIIKLNCRQTLSITANWTIKNCASNCSNEISLDSSIVTTFSELYIPARTLSDGVYELTLTITMVNLPHLTTSTSVYVRITPAGITANLVLLGTSLITSGHKQNLVLNPGKFSVDLDKKLFNASVSNSPINFYSKIIFAL